jgi:hypothetical protein
MNMKIPRDPGLLFHPYECPHVCALYVREVHGWVRKLKNCEILDIQSHTEDPGWSDIRYSMRHTELITKVHIIEIILIYPHPLVCVP